MRKKHNKFKNTSVIFEILCKKMTTEILNPTGNQAATKIIKKHFNSKSEILKELNLFQQVTLRGKEVDINELLGLLKNTRKSLNEQTLSKQKYDLIRDIRKNYDLKEFFSSRLSNYTLLAAVNNYFELNEQKYPVEFLKNKNLIVENISTQKPQIEAEIIEDKTLAKLTFKIIVEKFNEKYKDLLPKQRHLLSKYINEDYTTNDFKNYIISECNEIGKRLKRLISKESDPITKIKLNEVNNLLDHIITGKGRIKDEHLSALLKYYELVEELDK